MADSQCESSLTGSKQCPRADGEHAKELTPSEFWSASPRDTTRGIKIPRTSTAGETQRLSCRRGKVTRCRHGKNARRPEVGCAYPHYRNTATWPPGFPESFT